MENVSTSVSLNEEETKHYFNMYLNELEDNISENLGINKKQICTTWKPYDLKPSPIIDVTTALKSDLSRRQELKGERKNQAILSAQDIQSVKIYGLPINSCSLEDVETKDLKNIALNVPLNIKICSQQEINGRPDVSRKVLIIWKEFTRRKRVLKILEEKRKKVAVRLLKMYLNNWVEYVNCCKVMRFSKIYDAAKIGGTLFGEFKDQTNRIKSNSDPLNVQHKTIKMSSQSIIKIGQSNYKEHSSDIVEPNITQDDGGSNSYLLKCQSETNIYIKIVSPEDVGLVKPKLEYPLQNTNNKAKNRVVGGGKINQECFANRYAALEKIVEEQKKIIEKQEKTIVELQYKQLQAEYQLNSKRVESHITQIPKQFSIKLVPTIKIHSGSLVSAIVPVKQTAIYEHSELLNKRLSERQEYCKKLAEMTKCRKLNIEAEKAKQMLEQEEKERKDKKEHTKLRILHNKLEKQQAEAKSQRYLANKLFTRNLMQQSINHCNTVVLRKYFLKLKLQTMEVGLKYKACVNIYERTLIRKVLCSWNKSTMKILLSKINMAELFYNKNLLHKCLNCWKMLYQDYRMKLQVSDDMFCLKLQERMFHKWQEITVQLYLQTCSKMELAQQFHRKKLLRRCLRYWKMLPKFMFMERQKEQRIRAWRETVKQLIPDFSPMFADNLEL